MSPSAKTAEPLAAAKPAKQADPGKGLPLATAKAQRIKEWKKPSKKADADAQREARRQAWLQS